MALSIVFFILSIASILYGIVVMSAGSGSRFYLVWYVLAFFLLGLAAMSRLRIWSLVPRRLLRILLVLLVVLFLVFVLLLGMIVKDANAKGQKDADYLIVLGAQVFSDRPSLSLRYRLDAALAYLKENEKTRCIVSGGQGSNEPFTEAEGMRRYLTEKGIAPDRIIMEDRSTSTVENIRYSKELFAYENSSVLIVTNDFHMCRALRTARREGLGSAGALCAKSNPLYLANNVLREIFALARDFFL